VKSIVILCFLIALSLFYLDVSGQAGISYDLKKPEKYENLQLASEKPSDTKIKLTRHFIQNTITHYNYYFNANNKLNDVVARAKNLNRDDYTRLLSFYNYSLETTAKDKKELDSVIYKVTAGVLIHDLRTDWDDNLFMLMGKAYYFRKDLDTAYTIFQFINYAFSPKEKDGYDIPIASNANHDEGGSIFNVSTNENDRTKLKKMFSLPPSRNDALIWQIRTLLAMDQLTRASVLIQILNRDPQFPTRLQTDLLEVQSLWYYKQNGYDSAAAYLEKAMGNAVNQSEQSRWEYLIAQLYERAGKSWKAKQFYERVVKDSYDPVMNVYARLNAIRQTRSAGADYIQKNIDALDKMARKDVYAGYRDIIYYTAAEIELEHNNKAVGIAYLLKTVKYATPNSPQRSKAFVKLGNLAFDDNRLKLAKNYYDSVNVYELRALDSANVLQDRKAALGKIVPQLNIIEREDSLQRIAAMREEERTEYIKKLLKSLLRQQGVKQEEEEASSSGVLNTNNPAATDLFNTGSDNTEWYFYNSSQKSKGFSDFKTRWGNRDNVDDWFLTSLASRQRANSNKPGPLQGNASDNTNKQAAPTQVTFASLLANVPLSPEKLKKSRDSVENALFALGLAFQEDLPDYTAAINSFDSLLQRFPGTHWRAETFFNLYYCYKKKADEVNAARILDLMKQHYPDGKYKDLVRDSNSIRNPGDEAKTAATRKYEKIYTAFIEGDFEGALAQKRAADSLYGGKYWTPQLLYIEAVYFIQKKEDGRAIPELNNIVNRFPGTPMALKAKNLVSVLIRRREIESYLSNLKIERVKDDSTVVANDQVQAPRLFIPDSSQSARKGGDSSRLARMPVKKIVPPDPGKKQQADSAIAMQKIKLYQNQAMKIKTDSIQLMSLQHQADSIGLALKQPGHDSAKSTRLHFQMDSIQIAIKKLKNEYSQLAMGLSALKSSFSFTPALSHSVALLLTKVDPVYVTEMRNAFNRYNRETYYNRSFEISNVPLNDSVKLVLINGFDSAAAALDYLEQARKLAPREIIPWLPAGKYSFLIITDQNLELLKTNKDITAYKKFLETNFPGKF
jgi:outer membrane protein assembly factor BamD (BamD/ComL family)